MLSGSRPPTVNAPSVAKSPAWPGGIRAVGLERHQDRDREAIVDLRDVDMLAAPAPPSRTRSAPTVPAMVCVMSGAEQHVLGRLALAESEDRHRRSRPELPRPLRRHHDDGGGAVRDEAAIVAAQRLDDEGRMR